MKVFCDSSVKEACIVFEGEDPILVPYPKRVTNNVGEYKAVILALEKALDRKPETVELFTDSLLVANQVNGIWQCRTKHLLPLLMEVWCWLTEFDNTPTLSWVNREENPAGKVLEKRK